MASTVGMYLHTTIFTSGEPVEDVLLHELRLGIRFFLVSGVEDHFHKYFLDAQEWLVRQNRIQRWEMYTVSSLLHRFTRVAAVNQRERTEAGALRAGQGFLEPLNFVIESSFQNEGFEVRVSRKSYADVALAIHERGVT